MLNRIKIVSVIALLCVAFSYAHGIEQQDTLQVYSTEEYITFRVGNSVVDENFDVNDQRLSRINNHLYTLFTDSTLTNSSVEFSGMVSPETPDTTVVEEPIVEVQPIIDTQPKPFYMALKTNALYDLLAIPNIGVEFYLGKNWSAAANWHYAWWKTDRKHWYWRTYGGDVALRRWFGSKANEKPLTGHHIGVYGQILTYDFETGGRGYLGDRWSYAAGLEYGYSLPIKKRLNIDFTLGVGYLGGEYMEYLPMDDCYVWQATKDRKWFGPTKAEISLVWLLGSGNSNKIKGGKR